MAGSLPFSSKNGFGSVSGFSNTSDVKCRVLAPVDPVPLAAGVAFAGDGIFNFSFNTCEVAKKFGTTLPFFDEAAADEVDVEEGFSKLKGKGGVEFLEVVPKIGTG